MKEMLDKIKEQAQKQIAIASTPEALDEIRVSVLGKKGELTQILKGMKDVAPEDRPKVGQMVNSVRDILEEALNEQKKALKSKVIEKKMET
nr:phenylalanine--tRNA ligase subunit alpha [Eubacterium sp.]